MLLYWKNAATDGAWENTANWFEDAAATVNHGALPAEGDSCTLATGESGDLFLGTVTVNLGSGACDIFGLHINYATISGGTFSGIGIDNGGGTISGGTFTGADFTNSGTISGGIFTGADFANWGTISGGFWLQSGVLWIDGVEITGSGDVDPGFPNTLGGGVDPSTIALPAADLVSTAAGAFGYPGHSLTPTLDLTNLAAGNVRSGVTIAAVVGTYAGVDPSTIALPAADLVSTAAGAFGYPGNEVEPTLNLANLLAGNVRMAVTIGGITGTWAPGVPAATDVRSGVDTGDGILGSCVVPAAGDVRQGTGVDATTGTLAVPAPNQVLYGVPTDSAVGSLGLAALASLLPIDPTTGSITLVIGDDYKAADGRALDFVDPGTWPAAIASGRLTIRQSGDDAAPQLDLTTGAIVAGSSPQIMRFQPTHTQTATMARSASTGDQSYALTLTTSGGDTVTPIPQGTATILAPLAE